MARYADMPFPGYIAVLPVAGATLLITTPRSTVARILAFPPLRWIGLISYSLYLWHWPVIVFLKWYAGTDALNVQQQIEVLALAFVLTTTPG